MKVACLVSGGVDSSVALALMKNAGHDVTAYYLKIWLEDDMAFLGNCPWEEDMNYVRSVCDQLSVPLKIINMQQEYLETVVEYTITELKAGRTPSPDIMCNRNIKFGRFFDKIGDSFDKTASGHYAQIEQNGAKYFLKQSPDPVKDQTYFLTYLSQGQLSKILFPIGGYMKKQVRQMAADFNLPTQNRKDSQGICFLGKIKYNDFIKFHLGEKKGHIIEFETGKKLGYHKGFWFHTIGQRQGLGLGGGPWYVVKKDITENIIYVSRDKTVENVPRNKFSALNINWIPSKPRKNSFKVKLRHGPAKYDAVLESYKNKKAVVKLTEKDQGIAPGQFAIFYDGDYCCGGGVIGLV